MIQKKILLLIFLSAVIAFSETTSEIQIGAKIPRFGGTTLIDQKMITSKKWADSSFVMAISFGASWCVPCRVELPFLDSMSLKNPNMRAVSILIDEKPDKLKSFISQLELKMPVLHDVGAIFSTRFGVGTSLPFLILVDKKGIVRSVSTGFDIVHKETLKTQIIDLLQEGVE
jgi:thiol-disulfide isomerase/thioredoxin